MNVKAYIRVVGDDTGEIVLRDANMDLLRSMDAGEIAKFFSGNRSCCGMTVQYAVHRDGTVLCISKNGRLIQRDIKPLIEKGFDTWSFSWSWAPSTWEINGEPGKLKEYNI